MPTVAEAKNLGVCGAGNALGFNTDNGCADLFKAAHSIWLMSPSAYLDPTREFDLAYVKELQQAGNLIIIKGITQFQEIGSDDAVETLEDDTQETTNQGKYKFQATFKKGFYWQRALASVSGFGNWRTAIVDKTGDILMTDRLEGGSKGFTTGEIINGKLDFATNTTSLKQNLMWQLLERHEVDENYVIFKNSTLSFDPRDVTPVTQIYLSFDSAPANGNTTVNVKVVFDRGRKGPVGGILFSQFLNKINGATSNPTAVTTVDDIYTPTLPALTTGETGELSLYDNANNSSVVDIAGLGLVKSNTLSYTVVA